MGRRRQARSWSPADKGVVGWPGPQLVELAVLDDGLEDAGLSVDLPDELESPELEPPLADPPESVEPAAASPPLLAVDEEELEELDLLSVL